jgi:DNA-binding beta-propeller fold protein YncE
VLPPQGSFWTMRSLSLLLCVVGAVGCRCSDRIAQTPDVVRFVPTSLSFGPIWLGDTAEENALLKNDSRRSVTVQLRVEGPFTVDVDTVTLMPGESAPFLVRFVPQNTMAAVGRVVAEGYEAELPLAGIAEGVPECAGPSACRTSAFDKTSRACVESKRPDGTACNVKDRCIVSTGCADGQCAGVARQCPTPTNPCQVAECDSKAGCTVRAAPEGMRCGVPDCSGTPVCQAGACVVDRTQPTGCSHPTALWVKIPLAGAPFGLATDDGDVAYVGLATAGEVAAIDTAQAVHRGNVTVGSVPTGLVAGPNRVWVANQGSQSVSIIDRTSFSVVGSPLSLSMSPYIPALRAGACYLTGASSEVLKVDSTTNAVLATVTGTWSHANGVAFHPSRDVMYVTARDSGEVTEIELGAFRLGRTFPVTGQPQAIVATPDGRELWVARQTGPLAVLDASTGAIVAEVMGATGGFGLALTPDGQQLLMTRPASSDVIRIDRASRTVLGSVSTGGTPRRVGYASQGRIAVITNELGWVDLMR